MASNWNPSPKRKPFSQQFVKGAGTKADRMNAARKFWTCRACGEPWRDANRPRNRGNRPEPCPQCRKAEGFHYHMSHREFRRWQELVLAQRAGDIEQLMHQPSFDLKVNGMLVTTYTADAGYLDRRTRKYVVEDTKPENFMDEVAKMKITLWNAVFAPRTVTIVKVRL